MHTLPESFSLGLGPNLTYRDASWCFHPIWQDLARKILSEDQEVLSVFRLLFALFLIRFMQSLSSRVKHLFMSSQKQSHLSYSKVIYVYFTSIHFHHWPLVNLPVSQIIIDVKFSCNAPWRRISMSTRVWRHLPNMRISVQELQRTKRQATIDRNNPHHNFKWKLPLFWLTFNLIDRDSVIIHSNI